MSEDEDNFVAAGSGASMTVPQQASALRKGGFVIVRGFPCKVRVVTMRTVACLLCSFVWLTRSSAACR